ncbi:uncharacterized protein PpBr36_11180 [Pyricularia pennisetigena]|uniref:uncharacterized protein n=1 Tax=Pyricularia pennisetigena TaxID=1578925 RepID=UPI0011539F0F|nr:uncharacterized protein PpBr36_11180 [Pyricularia pennisetigena]TLS20530.1 hypothetical protein PpBr36_11180 [Pyricularia pennisetigena]
MSAPEEMSSERPVSRYREVVKSPPNARPKPRDVRFEQELTGEGYQRNCLLCASASPPIFVMFEPPDHIRKMDEMPHRHDRRCTHKEASVMNCVCCKDILGSY